jgi:putative addiction module killer protein
MSLGTQRLLRTREFLIWLNELPSLLRKRVSGRLEQLAMGHLGDSRSLGNGLFELRWRMGMRVYYTRRRVGEVDSIVLIGGFKGTQHGDIDKARAIQAAYERRLLDGRSA